MWLMVRDTLDSGLMVESQGPLYIHEFILQASDQVSTLYTHPIQFAGGDPCITRCLYQHHGNPP